MVVIGGRGDLYSYFRKRNCYQMCHVGMMNNTVTVENFFNEIAFLFVDISSRCEHNLLE
jgi:hypothetical protein